MGVRRGEGENRKMKDEWREKEQKKKKVRNRNIRDKSGKTGKEKS